MGKIRDWLKGKEQKKKEEEEWKAQIKKEALEEAREELKAELKAKYVADEKERLKSGKSKFMSALEKEFSSVGDKFKNREDGSTGKSVKMSEESHALDFRGKLEREFGTRDTSNTSKSIFKSGDEINSMLGVRKSDDVINKNKIEQMLGKSVDTSNPQDKIGHLDFKSGVERATPKFKKYKSEE